MDKFTISSFVNGLVIPFVDGFDGFAVISKGHVGALADNCRPCLRH
jgi:hypothetical protein